MKILLVPWMLLLFGRLSSGHYIRQAEDGDFNVYEVRDGSSGVSFVNPKPEKPTLREILFYHVIERGHGEPITERSFTNSHGYQFLEPERSDEQDLPYDQKQEHDGEYLRYEKEEQDDSEAHNENEEDNENDGHDDLEHPDGDHEVILEDAENHDDEVLEPTTTQRPLTDEDVKEAYKSRSYLFDQMRQRYSVKRMAVPDTLNRRKRQADMQPVPDAPSLSSDISSKDAYIQPKTYGMNLNPEGGFVWNNLNKPPTYYELGPSNGNPNEGQYESTQNQENISKPSENAYIPPTQSQEYIPPAIENAYIPPTQSQEYIPPAIENAYVSPTPEISDSSSSEDIYVNTNRPNPMPLEQEPNAESSEPINENPEPLNKNPEPINVKPEPINDNPQPNDSAPNYPVAPVIGGDESNDKSESDEGVANYPMGPEVYNPEPSYPEIPTIENPRPIQSVSRPGESEVPKVENPVNEGSVEPVQSNENPVPGYEASQPEEPKPENSPEESTEGDKIKEIPEAPTLPPINYDNLPSYIRDAISSTEKPASYEQTENPYTNPQTNSEDKKAMEDKMEDIFATMKPVEDIPKTYGMNLTSGGGHVWNDMVNPPVSYDIGLPSKPEEEHAEEPTKAPEIKEPETHESEEANIPIEKPAEPEKDGGIEEPIAKPNKPNQEQPKPHESEDANNPIEEPAEPENKGEIKEPLANPNQGKPEPQIPNKEDNKPIKEPNQPLEAIKPEPEIEHEDHPETEEMEQPEDSEEPSEENEQDEPAEIKPVQEKPDIMSELLKSEQFWKWLGEWTATYMELLEKHIRKIAIQEICNHEKAGRQMCLLDVSPKDTGVVIKDGKITVDGKEIDIPHSDNLDKELKRGSHNNNNKEGNGNKIEASTIYGNSVGNEKVTNVFIFAADKADEVIDKLKPANDSKVDFVIDDRIKEENKEENKEKSHEDESDGDGVNEGELSKDESNKGAHKDEEDNENSKGNSDNIEASEDGGAKETEDETKPELSEGNTIASKDHLENK